MTDPAVAFEWTVRPHLTALYRLAHHLTGAPDRAEDLVQSLLLRLYQRPASIEGLERPGPWLARSLYHLFVDQHRQRRRQPIDLRDDEGDDDFAERPAGDQHDPAVMADRDCLAAQLQRALAALNPDQRALLVWHDVEGYTLEELSTRDDTPLGTLKSRLHRARARMRVLLTEPTAAFERVE